jgi:hypothetical protein
MDDTAGGGFELFDGSGEFAEVEQDERLLRGGVGL